MSRASDVRLVEMSLGALDAEAASAGDLGALLGAVVPSDWPPPYHDAGVRAWFRARLVADRDAAGWWGWYVVATVDGAQILVGTAGYKGPPDATGIVEVGYSIVESYRRRGIASAALRQLLDRAFDDPRVSVVKAETPVTFAASRGLLGHCGFALTGTRTDAEEGELALYEIARS